MRGPVDLISNMIKILNILRFILAWVLTVTILGGPIYSLSSVRAPALLLGETSTLVVGTRPSSILNFLHGSPELKYAGFFLIGIVLVFVLTFRKSEEGSQNQSLSLGIVVILSWIVANAYLYHFRFSSGIEFPPSVVLYLAAGLWLPWLAWIGFWPLGWKPRIFVLSTLLVIGPVLVLLNCRFFMTGEELVDIAFRSRNREVQAIASIAPETSSKSALLSETTLYDYSQFRGANRNGVGRATAFETDWSSHPPKLLWHKSVGAGWSGFAIVGDFAITQDQIKDQERVTCYRVSDGEPIWIHTDTVDRLEHGGPGPRATPTISNGRVFTMGSTGILNCLNGIDGSVIWSVDTMLENKQLIEGQKREYESMFGLAGSPLVVSGLVVVSLNGENKVSLVAYDETSGDQVWRIDDRVGSYCSPTLATLAGVDQILDFASEEVSGHDVKTGSVLWSFPWSNIEKVNCAQPLVVGSDQVLLTTKKGEGTVMLKVDCDDGETWEVEELWKSNALKCEFNSPVADQDSNFAYSVNDGVLTCVNLRTGKRVWRNGRYGRGQLIRVGEHLLIQTERGRVALVEASPKEYKEVAKIPALEGTTWNYPAIAGRILVVRNDREAACYELQEPE